MSHTAGGRVSTVINGVPYSARGEITLSPSNISNESGVNQDGTVYRIVKPKARKAELTFDRFVTVDDRPLIWDERVMNLMNIPVTFVEDDTGLTHILSGSFFEGEPQGNLATGEVSGLSIAASGYKTLNG
ncbi:hypothetical protein DYI24_19805 [Rhodopseudomonas sp. BR0C11]|uniref:phage tail tube protein n=1 Tax=Rhodopseudomonas sp. BR0C11 TaxID=2269370 RepID=UPI0013E05D66|nr:phage tail tube protein [Rhodopseudomonas sp. BR0C11]NEV79279.1 hypothetical protein [Rhodopseudomonas sp. BR0C11]